QNALSAAAKDPEVLRQINNTRKIRNVQNFYQTRLEKGDINQQNFQYAFKKSGIGAYLNGDTDDVGDFQYLEYSDYDANMDEAVRKLKAANPNELVTLQDPQTGEIRSRKVSMLTQEEIAGYVRSRLTANDRKQMEIDGAMMYGMDDAAATASRDNVIAQGKAQYDERISLLEAYRDNGNSTEGQKEEYNRQIELLNKSKSDFESNLIGQRTAEAIGGAKILDDRVNLYARIYSKDGPESLTYDND